MPSQLSMSQLGGDDQHPVESRLPINDKEFAECSIHHPTVSNEPREQNELYTSTGAELPSNLKSWTDHSDFMTSETSQMMDSNDDWAGLQGAFGNELESWESTNEFQDISFIAETQMPQINPWDMDCSDSAFGQLPIAPTAKSQREEDLNWAEYICIPQEKQESSEFNIPTDFTPSIPSAPNSASPAPTPKSPTKPTNKTITQRRQKMNPTTAPLRPKFYNILPSPSQESAPKTRGPDASSPTQTPRSKASGRGCKRPKTDEEALRKRRNYQRIAEQSRRLRLNSALKDLEALLPSDLVQEKSLASPALDPIRSDKKKTPSEQTKACVMELAVEYIKMLRTTLNEKNGRMLELGAACPGILL